MAWIRKGRTGEARSVADAAVQPVEGRPVAERGPGPRRQQVRRPPVADRAGEAGLPHPVQGRLAEGATGTEPAGVREDRRVAEEAGVRRPGQARVPGRLLEGARGRGADDPAVVLDDDVVVAVVLAGVEGLLPLGHGLLDREDLAR